MNIQQAKEEIINAVRVYLAKDEYGAYLIPLERQRPLFLLGAPGIGKTAIMEQVARELGIGLVSYSMTHHTRQSALGLPYIDTREFGGAQYRVSEYTMSEIIASVYQEMEETGAREGILFLDEINCVSETLTPAILQFLQYKVFGRHRVPDGWIVVTAGNPSEYNRSTHDFDVATWDRLKRIDVEPYYAAWRSYAQASHVHPAILAYLDAEGADFYHVETTLDGKTFTTARGWDDLSQAMNAYEREGIAVTERLIGQYLQDARIAKRFCVYYELFKKYRADYRIDAILDGAAPVQVLERARAAAFDERVALIGLLTSALSARLQAAMRHDAAAAVLHERVVAILGQGEPAAQLGASCGEQASELRERIAAGRAHRSATADELAAWSLAEAFFDARACDGPALDEEGLKAAFAAFVSALDEQASAVRDALTHAYAFLDEAFGAGRETLLFTTDLSALGEMVGFVNAYGCESYLAHSEELMFQQRGEMLRERAKQSMGQA